MISTIWKFLNEHVLNNVFSISLLLLGTLLLVVAVSLGPKLLQKEKKNKRGAIEKKVDTAFKKTDNEIGSSIAERFKEDEHEEEEENGSKSRDEEEEGSKSKTEDLSRDEEEKTEGDEEELSKASVSKRRRNKRK